MRTATDPVEDFKNYTAAKLRDVMCPVHQQPPRVRVSGASLREVTVSLSGCCSTLIGLANKAIGANPAPAHSIARINLISLQVRP